MTPLAPNFHPARPANYGIYRALGSSAMMKSEPSGGPVVATAEPGVAANLAALGARIDEGAMMAGRAAGSVQMVAVAKAHPVEAAAAAVAAGHLVFGENRVQEAQLKWPALRGITPGLVVHLIGPLQTNKVRDALELFDVIETVDRPKLAAALAREIDRTGHRPPCLIQVNTGEEPQKAGIGPAEADEFIAECRRDYALPIEGLMCVPPIDQEAELHFALLAELALRNGLSSLSMGMTADFETAIRMGATHVRLGTAIFGSRPSL